MMINPKLITQSSGPPAGAIAYPRVSHHRKGPPMQRSTDRILTTHTGSLIRPSEVVALMHGRRPGQPFDAAASDTLARTVTEVVARQVEAGIDIVGDGEYAKSGFASYVGDRLAGFSRVEGAVSAPFTGRDRKRFAEAYAELDAPTAGGAGPVLTGGIGRAPTADLACTGPISYIGQAQLAADLTRLTDAARAAGAGEAFYPATAPGTIAMQRPNRYYASDDEYLLAVAEAMAVEYRSVVEAGLILQIDDPRAVTAYDSMDPPPPPEQYRGFLQVRVEALNHALAGIPADRVRYHVCWGSWHGPHTTDIELKHIIDTILTINAQAFVLEAANPRHAHEYHVFEDVKLPEGTILVPGVVTHSTNVVEHPELVAERIDNYAQLVGRENVMAGTDCGFAQSYAAKRVPEAIQWEKLRMLAAGAALASQRLWRS
jgi:5-methyltetrahydropteroyltriglutamate--homocysteine methyltransferase